MTQEVSQHEPLTPRDRYLARRHDIEQYFISHNPNNEIVSGADGAKTRVLSTFYKVPEALKSAEQSDSLRVTVFLPGMFKTEKPNFGNHPLEIKLASALLTGDTDAVMHLKAEGLNDAAFLDRDGNGVVQKKSADAAMVILQKEVEDLSKSEKYQGRPVHFRVLGYSDGASQGASVALRIAESGLGTVDEVVAIGGAGLSGVENQQEAAVVPITLMKNNISEAKKIVRPHFPVPGQHGSVYHTVDGDNVYVAAKLMGNRADGLEASLGPARIDALADMRNVGKWTGEFLASKLFGVDGVPSERLRALWSKNRDYEKLVSLGIPLKVFASYGDQFFNYDQVKSEVERLRSEYKSRIMLVSVDGDHGFAHTHTSSVAFAVQAFSDVLGFHQNASDQPQQ